LRTRAIRPPTHLGLKMRCEIRNPRVQRSQCLALFAARNPYLALVRWSGASRVSASGLGYPRPRARHPSNERVCVALPPDFDDYSTLAAPPLSKTTRDPNIIAAITAKPNKP
jgi:hypothetical protein